MTPKEKAQELVDKLYQTTPNESYVNDPIGVGRYEAWQQAKQCALIAVDEILDVLNKIHWVIVGKDYKYWQEVKTEIEKL